jgi:hypothetical protein
MITYKGLPAPVISNHVSREMSRKTYADGTQFQIWWIDIVANTGTYIDTSFRRYDEGHDLVMLPLAKDDSVISLERTNRPSRNFPTIASKSSQVGMPYFSNVRTASKRHGANFSKPCRVKGSAESADRSSVSRSRLTQAGASLARGLWARDPYLSVSLLLSGCRPKPDYAVAAEAARPIVRTIQQGRRSRRECRRGRDGPMRSDLTRSGVDYDDHRADGAG